MLLVVLKKENAKINRISPELLRKASQAKTARELTTLGRMD